MLVLSLNKKKIIKNVHARICYKINVIKLKIRIIINL